MLVAVARIAIKVLPESIASPLTRVLAAMTQRQPVSPLEREALNHARQLRFGDGDKNVAWVWGTGPLVVLVHGWNGRAAQMAPLALRLSEFGFQSVAIDVTGHGDSPKRHTRWDYFFKDIAALSQVLKEPVFAYVGHSAGALTVMAARGLKGIAAKRYVCICAPSYPFPPINVIQRKLSPKKAVIDRYKNFLAEQFETTWEHLQTGSSYIGAGFDLLLFYDETDRFVDHGEGDKIKSLCPGAQLVKTCAYSHNKVLAAPELMEATAAFLMT
jgi:esterase/lipase